MARSRFSLAVFSIVALSPLGARAHVESGTPVDNVDMATLAGGKEKLLSAKARANIVLFFRPNQERSLDALKQMARCEKDLSGKPVHWVAVVSSTAPVEDVKSAVRQSGIGMPVLVDQDDVLYDKIGIRLHPMVAIVDSRFRIAAVEMYRQIDYCDVIEARIRLLLGDIQQAELDKVLNPERSALPGEDLPKKAMRDVNMARKLIEIGQPDKAIERCKRALEIAPVAAAFSMMGDAYAKKGDCAQANEQYRRALELDSKDVRALEGRKGCR